MEYLVTYDFTYVPDGTPEQAMNELQDRRPAVHRRSHRGVAHLRQRCALCWTSASDASSTRALRRICVRSGDLEQMPGELRYEYTKSSRPGRPQYYVPAWTLCWPVFRAGHFLREGAWYDLAFSGADCRAT